MTINIEIKPSEKVNGDDSAFLSFPYDSDLIALMRNQSNRFWHADKKVWEIPATKLAGVLTEVKNHEIIIKGDYRKMVKRDVKAPAGFKFKTNPFQHQIQGFEYGLRTNRFLLGDEQGLGKTKQVIDIAIAKKLAFGYKHCLIVCGVNGLKWNWVNEVHTHSDEDAFILGTRVNTKGKKYIGSTADKLADLNNLPSAYFLITNVENLRDAAVLTRIQQLVTDGIIPMVAIDEIHKCKNPSAQQGKAILKVAPETRIAMTGTPLMNTPLDLYVPLKWLGYEKHSFFQFKSHYCVMGGYGGYEIVGYQNLNELREMVDKVMLRRLKKDVLDLPEKLHSTEYVEMTAQQARIYKEVKLAVQSDIDRILLSANPLAQLIRLRQATGYTGILTSNIHESAKLDRLEELVEELVENGDKAIIFSNWTDMTEPTAKRLSRFNPAIITGETKDRQAEQAKFMNDASCHVIIGTIGAMGTGLTLTAGSTVIFLDSPWNRANKEQAEDRAHRIGTTKNVNVITLVCKDTIDERIEELIAEKGELADQLVDGMDKKSREVIIDFLLS